MIDSFTPAFFRHLQQLKIRTRRAFLGSRQGGHVSLRRGHGLEFADFRLYSPGDDFRHIDWGIFARSERLYIKQFREEQDLNVIFLLDCSASMSLPENDHKFELCQELSLALSYVALSDGDTIRIASLGKELSPRFANARSWKKVATFLKEQKPAGHINLPYEIGLSMQRQKTPGKCFLISDFYYPHEDIFQAVRLLLARNFEVVLFHVLGNSELELKLDFGNHLIVDSETGETVEVILDQSSVKDYAYALADHIATIEKFAVKIGVPHILISSAEDVREVVLKRLPQLGLLK
ncbi:MAG: DUF58 domain-containing protein [Deltaproteobacteria bacterium]|nr:DUF58 domain-containing protein [Deltaproteobacteria bacterium]